MNDPIIFLSNEHTALLRQLDLLKRPHERGEEIIDLLRTLERDSTVHFRREDLLLDVLSSKLEHGGNQLKSLMTEHESFSWETKNFIEMMTPLKGYSPFLTGRGVEHKFREFTEQFRAHIYHEETVVYLLAKTRLTPEELHTISRKILIL